MTGIGNIPWGRDVPSDDPSADKSADSVAYWSWDYV